MDKQVPRGIVVQDAGLDRGKYPEGPFLLRDDTSVETPGGPHTHRTPPPAP